MLEIERLLGFAAEETHELLHPTDIKRRFDVETVRKQIVQLERRRNEIDLAIAELKRTLTSQEPGT